jgi:hypothetical protein
MTIIIIINKHGNRSQIQKLLQITTTYLSVPTEMTIVSANMWPSLLICTHGELIQNLWRAFQMLLLSWIRNNRFVSATTAALIFIRDPGGRS